MGLLVGALLSTLILNIYATGAENGFFGKEAKEKYEYQAFMGTGPIDILLGGRSEILVSTVAIKDSPLIGHGSWAKDIKYLILLNEIKAQLGDDNIRPISEDRLAVIPSHSYLFGAWVESGLAGAIFWLTALWLIIFRVLPNAFSHPSPLSILILMVLLPFLWNVLFSPFGANVRLEAAFFIVTFLSILSANNNSRSIK